MVAGVVGEQRVVAGVVPDRAQAWLDHVAKAFLVHLVFIAAGNGKTRRGAIRHEALPIQCVFRKQHADVDREIIPADGVIDFDDSYALLMHVVGEALDNTYITSDSISYNISTMDEVFKPTDTKKSCSPAYIS